jgi:hypothetical protein
MNRMREELLKHIRLLMKEVERKNEELNTLQCEILRLQELIVELQIEKIKDIRNDEPFSEYFF